MYLHCNALIRATKAEYTQPSHSVAEGKKNARFFILSLRILVPSVFLSARIHFGNKLLLTLLQMLPRLLNAIKLKLNGINKNGKLNT